MAQQYENPFENLNLIAPESQREFYDQYCQRQTVGRINVDRRPFRWMVDLWFVGFSVAVRKQLNPIDLKNQKTFQFIKGSVFNNDSWRTQVVMLIAIAIEENVKVVDEPELAMEIANGYAAAGVDLIVDMLSDGDQTPIWNLSDALDNLLRNDDQNTEESNHTHLLEKAFK